MDKIDTLIERYIQEAVKPSGLKSKLQRWLKKSSKVKSKSGTFKDKNFGVVKIGTVNTTASLDLSKYGFKKNLPARVVFDNMSREDILKHSDAAYKTLMDPILKNLDKILKDNWRDVYIGEFNSYEEFTQTLFSLRPDVWIYNETVGGKDLRLVMLGVIDPEYRFSELDASALWSTGKLVNRFYFG